MVWRNASSLPAHSTQESRWAFTSGVTAVSPAARSGISSRVSSQLQLDFMTASFVQKLSCALHKLFELFAQRFVGAKQQRLGGGLAQLQNVGNLAIVHLLILVHHHRHSLPLGQGSHTPANGGQTLLLQQVLFGAGRPV